jgi:carboxylesterase type B
VPKRFTHSIGYHGTGNNASATAYGSACYQSGGGSEDCLFLNLWTPFLPAHGGAPVKDLKPVMLWIHGGGYTSGTANDPTFDGGNIASRGDVVLVACNYRLGPLGFLVLDDGVTKGNYGLGDAINALDWVRRNIHDFGGDPERITVFGQSAGAASVRAIMASPKAKGKFKAAISMSNLGGGGYGESYSSWMSLDTAVSHATPILAATNCTTATSQVDCLRAVPASTLSTGALGTAVRYLVVDGMYLKGDQLPLSASAKRSLSNVHLLQGLMRDDGAAITSYIQTTNLSQSITTDGFNTSVVLKSGLFPIPKGANKTLNVFNVTARVATDTIFRCSDEASAYAGLLNDVFAPNQYFYEFNRSYQTPNWNPNAPVCQAPVSLSHPKGDPDQEYFKCHSGDLYYVFGTILRMGYPLRDDNDLLFQQFILDAWTSFARTYDPNPSQGFLEARGYVNTSDALQKFGLWPSLSKSKADGLTARLLQMSSRQVPFQDTSQCAVLGWPIELYL